MLAPTSSSVATSKFRSAAPTRTGYGCRTRSRLRLCSAVRSAIFRYSRAREVLIAARLELVKTHPPRTTRRCDSIRAGRPGAPRAPLLISARFSAPAGPRIMPISPGERANGRDTPWMERGVQPGRVWLRQPGAVPVHCPPARRRGTRRGGGRLRARCHGRPGPRPAVSGSAWRRPACDRHRRRPGRRPEPGGGRVPADRERPLAVGRRRSRSRGQRLDAGARGAAGGVRRGADAGVAPRRRVRRADGEPAFGAVARLALGAQHQARASAGEGAARPAGTRRLPRCTG